MSHSGTATQSHIQDLTDSPAISTGVPLVGRILMGAIFLISGLGKIAAPAGTIGYIASAGLPLPQLGLAIAVFVEVVGSIALIAGYRTRSLQQRSRSSVWQRPSVSTSISPTRISSFTSSRTSQWSVGYCRLSHLVPVVSASMRDGAKDDHAAMENWEAMHEVSTTERCSIHGAGDRRRRIGCLSG